MFNREAFQNALLRWFHGNNRELPWRDKYNPYHIWLSEIMLQQTQMERGIRYFERWLCRYPDIAAVASSSLDEILKYWEGLGYYARARNLHKAAKVMCDEYGGRVPESYEQLLSLPGIGSYTASAIASIAFNQDVVVVDANVERVFSRLFDIDAPLKNKGVHQRITGMARDLLPLGRAREFNQGLMDLGGMVCTPKNPDCGVCPVSANCLAYKGNFVEDRPVKGTKESQVHIEMATALLFHQGTIFIQQRKEDDIWGGLWEFPGGRLKQNEAPEAAVVREYMEETGFQVGVSRRITTVVHYYTKYKVTLHCFCCRLLQNSLLPNLRAAQKYHWITEDQLSNFGFPAGHRKFIEHLYTACPEVLTRGC